MIASFVHNPEWWKAVFDDAPEAAAVIDADGRILCANAKMPLAAGDCVFEPVAAQYQPAVRAMIARVFQEGQPGSCDFLSDDLAAPIW
jgi:hypothetical protein